MFFHLKKKLLSQNKHECCLFSFWKTFTYKLHQNGVIIITNIKFIFQSIKGMLSFPASRKHLLNPMYSLLSNKNQRIIASFITFMMSVS